jgi:uncharacterized protein (TIGR03663 family)
VLAVAGVALAALGARLVALGARPFHWDEARVGYWTLRYLDTGAWEYRPVAGGPFLYLVGRHVVDLFGAGDAVARLPVAVVGGLLPMAALLFRGRMTDGETVALAALLAANPLLVYYSRFLRGDVVAAAFGLVAVGATVRAYDGDGRFAHLAAASGALALTASSFAVAYPVAWLVAGLLTLDHDRLLGRPEAARERLAALGERLRSGWRTLAGAGAVGGLVLFVFFAPRAGTRGGPGLWKPTTLPAVAESAFVGTVRKFLGVRVVHRSPGGTHEILPYLAGTAEALAVGALPLAVLALFALARDRYGTDGPRPVVAFHAYWGLFGLYLFAVVAEGFGTWVAVHAVVPLAVPAAVGGAAVVRFAADAFDGRRTRDVAAAGLLVLAVALQTGAVAAGGVYAAPAPESGLAGNGQPADDLDPFYANVSAVAGANEGADVLLYGDRFHLAPAERADTPPVPDRWGNRLPLAWYLARADANVTSTVADGTIDDPPPVVVAAAGRRAEISGELSGYEASEYRTALWNRRVVVFVRR